MSHTPARELAALLRPLAEHLHRFPHLPHVVIQRDNDLQATGFRHRGEPVDAHAVLLWAKTLADPVVTIRPFTRAQPLHTEVAVTGGINGTQVRVWSVDEHTLHRLVDNRQPTTISVQQLADYVAGIGVAA